LQDLIAPVKEEAYMEEIRSTILAVDDHPANLNLLFDLLTDAGFDLLVAQSGESALSRAEKTRPDIILLDVMMPGLDGFETCRLLKANPLTQKIPVIFMTALSDTVDKVTGFELGAVDYITKPIQAEEVLARIRTHLTIQRLQNDISEKNKELEKFLAQEKELNQLKTHFLSMASHEFRTPLTVIQLSSNLLKRYGGRMSDEKRAEECAVIEKAIGRMSALLNDVLMIAKGESGKVELQREHCNIRELCQQVVETYTLLSDGTHIVTIEFIGVFVPIAVDPKLLHHVFSNLLSNAIKYSPKGGAIVVHVEQTSECVVWQISDQGMGIPVDELPHLFEVFHRAKNATSIQGTGLGLSIVKQFVELHGGTITVSSVENQGTTFIVTLPVYQ
jgi:two-component system, sensor histidine kinase and response regulator